MYFSRIKSEKPGMQEGALNKHIGKCEDMSQLTLIIERHTVTISTFWRGNTGINTMLTGIIIVPGP